MEKHFDEFFNAYIAAALWTSCDNSDSETGGEPLDANYSADDFDAESLENLKATARVFFFQQGPFITAREKASASTSGEWSLWEQAGHDLWLTQNRHGAGFWDRPETLWGPYADKFTKAAQALSEIDIYVGDDGKLYV